eukprot:352506-Alexandrium_andersonii.AAC.1
MSHFGDVGHGGPQLISSSEAKRPQERPLSAVGLRGRPPRSAVEARRLSASQLIASSEAKRP